MASQAPWKERRVGVVIGSKRWGGWSLVASIVLLLVGCSKSSGRRDWTEGANLRVLCTTEMIEALVEGVGAPYIEARSLICGELDPHSYQLIKGDSERVSKAQIIFCNGLGLEHGPSLRAALDQHPAVVYLGDRLPLEKIIQHGQQLDPHIWLDVQLFAALIPAIAEELGRLDPDHAAYYQERAQERWEELRQLDRALRERFAKIDPMRRYLVTSHEAFYYLARAYLAQEGEQEHWRERAVAPEGLAPESQISVHRIVEIANYIEKHRVKTAFLEANVNSDAIYKIQRSLAAQGYLLDVPHTPLYSDCMPAAQWLDQGTWNRYLEMINHNADLILQAWGEDLSVEEIVCDEAE